jgi:multiple sugar transport system substrate-binding protein
MSPKTVSRRQVLRGAGLAMAGAGITALVGCQPKVVEVEKVVKETVVVTEEKIVKEAVEVEKEVTRVVEKQVEAPKEPVEILHLDRNIPQDLEFRRELAQRFAEMHPDIKVTVEVIPEGYAQTIQARIASGTAGDLFRHATHWGMGNYALRGLLYPLDDFVDQDGFDLEAYFPGAISANQFEGKLYALPVNGHPGWSGVYYQPELFAEAGVDEPTDEWTYDDMVAAAQAMTKDTTGDGRTDQYGLWVNHSYEATLTPISAFGGWPQDESGTKATWDDPNTIAGLQWVYDCMNTWKIALQKPTFDSRVQLWSSGKVGMVLSGIWEGAYLGNETPADKTMKLATGPIGPSGERGGFVGVNNFPIWRSSQHAYEAWTWNKYICSKEIGIENVERIGEPGLRFDVWEDPLLTNDPFVAPHYALLSSVKPMPEPANGRLAELRQAVQPVIEGIVLMEITVEEGIAEIQQKSQSVLDMAKPGAG